MNEINEATFFLFKSEKTDDGHLKQMREGLRNNLFFLFDLSIFINGIIINLISTVTC